ncbi:uncharacterized protein LOC144163006 isoform X1 [Haemaphysalis longicornis]
MLSREGAGKGPSAAPAELSSSSSSLKASLQLHPLSRWARQSSWSSGTSSGESVELHPLSKWVRQQSSLSGSSEESAFWRDFLRGGKTEKPLPESPAKKPETQSRADPKPVPSPARKRVLATSPPPETPPQRKLRTVPEAAAAGAAATPKSLPRPSLRSTTTPEQSPSAQRRSSSFFAVPSPPQERPSRQAAPPVSPVPRPPRRRTGSEALDAVQPEPVPSPHKSTGRSPAAPGSRHSGKRSGDAVQPEPVPSPRKSTGRSPAASSSRRSGKRSRDAVQPEPVPSPRKSTGRSPVASGSRHSGRRSGAESSQKAPSSRLPSKHHSKKGGALAKRPAGYRARREIARLQNSTKLLIPRLPFARLVREILWLVTGEHYLMQVLALQVLQEAAEAVIVAVLEGSNSLATHAKRVTVMHRDVAALVRLCKSHGSLGPCLS